MSGDSQYSNTVLKFRGGPKIIKVEPHEAHYPHGRFIVGICGIAQEMVELQDFFRDPEAYGKPPRISRETKGLVLTEEGQLYMFETPRVWLRLDEPHFAIGSGSLTALGALHAGGSTKDAVKAAAKVDPYTGGKIHTLKFT